MSANLTATGSRMYFPVEEYEERWTRVYEELKRQGYAAAIVWGRSAGTKDRCGDVLYLTNFYSTHGGQEMDTKLWNGRAFAAVLFADGEAPELHTDEADSPQDLLATDRVEWHWDVIEGAIAALRRRGIEGRVALVGSDVLPMKYGQQLETALPEIDFEPQDGLIEDVRHIKSPRELDCYREAAVIATAGLDALMHGLITGKTEADAAAAAAAAVISRGGSYHMIPTSHGDRIQYFQRNPLTGYSLDAPQPGDYVRGWVYGPVWQGYWLDPGRTTIAGSNPTQSQRELIEATVSIIDSCIEAIEVGARVMDVAALGEQFTEEWGGEKDQAAEQWPLFGHGIGMFWERPWIGTGLANEDERFEEHMVLGIEAFLADSEGGAAGFEQNVIVTSEGTELLTTTPMVFW